MQPLVREGKSGYISNARAAFFRCHALHFSNAARNFNAWQAAMDIPKDLESARCHVAGILDSLQDRSASLSDMAASYIKSAEGFILPDLGMPKPQRGVLASYLLPSALFAQGPTRCGGLIQQDCEGNWYLTGPGWAVVIIAVAGLLVGCAFWMRDKED